METPDNKYKSIDVLSQFLKIDAAKLEKHLTGTTSKERWEQFHDIIVRDTRGLVREFESIEWQNEIEKIAEKKYNEVMLLIKNAKIDARQQCEMNIPFMEIKCKMNNGKKWKDRKLTNRSIGWHLNNYPPLSDTQLDDFLYNRYPEQTIGSWLKVATRLIKENYMLTLGKTWEQGHGGPHGNGGLAGKLTISW